MPEGFGGIISELISPTKYPKVPAAPNVNPQAAQQQSIAGNLQVLPQLEQLGSGINAFNLQQRRTSASSIPGFNALTQQGSNNILSFLQGNVPGDVQNQIQRSTAGQALAGGYGGSQFAHALTARDLGTTSLGLQQTGQQLLNPYLGTLGNLLMPQQFNVQSGFLSPEQQISASQWNEQQRYNQQATQNYISSLPDPLMRKVGDFAGDVGNIALTALTAYAGGGIGGMMGGSMGGMIGSQIGGQVGGAGGGQMGQYFSNLFAPQPSQGGWGYGSVS